MNTTKYVTRVIESNGTADYSITVVEAGPADRSALASRYYVIRNAGEITCKQTWGSEQRIGKNSTALRAALEAAVQA